ncbi:MAG: chemotaxis protein CheC [Lachnospiraceae bacterium]|nr:chemotaxis protein CheC [Butyrivibrio sp.]MBR0172199.1 chemotaxis protein CheC [Lachnospiraceae bacterium]
MANLSMQELNAQYGDMLRELGNIGAGNATSALSQMLDLKLDMSVPEVRLLEFKDVGSAMGGADQVMVGIYLMVEGDIGGSMMFLLDAPSARHLVNILMSTPDAKEETFSEIELSALKEVGNIITGAYLNSLSMMTNLAIVPSVPYITVDMLGAIISVPAIAFGTEADEIMLINTQFFADVKLDGYFMMLPDMESYAKILKALGMGDFTIG